MNENDFSAAFDAEDAFASRMDYMRRRRRRRRREVEKEEEEEEEKVRRQRASEPRRICFVLDGTQKITRNSRSHLGQGLVKYCSKCEAFARNANASLEKIHRNFYLKLLFKTGSYIIPNSSISREDLCILSQFCTFFQNFYSGKRINQSFYVLIHCRPKVNDTGATKFWYNNQCFLQSSNYHQMLLLVLQFSLLYLHC